MHWYLASILSLVFFSLQYFLYKVAAEKNADSKLVTFSFMATVTVLGLIVYFFQQTTILDAAKLFYFAFAAGGTFLLATLLRLQSLKFIPASVAFLIFDFKVIAIALISIYYFKDVLTVWQLLGIVLIFIAGLLIIQKQTGETEKYTKFNRGIALALGVVLCLSINGLVTKQAATENYNPFIFITIAYFINSVLAFSFYKLKTAAEIVASKKYSIKIGLIIGLFNFFAFYFEFTALRSGPLGPVTAIISFSTLGAILLSAIAFKEKFELKRAAGLVLGFISLLLLR